MARVPEAPRPSSSHLHSPRPSARRLSNFSHTARLAAVLLLLVWIGPVTFVQTDSWRLLRMVGAPERASAESITGPPGRSSVIPAGEAMLLDPGTPIKLHLRDGSVLEGRYLGRALLDSALYASRFASHPGSSADAPFALGETLHVSLRDGRELNAPFAGYAELTLLLRSPEAPQYLRVPFEFAREIHRANGDRVEPMALARAFHAHLLPSAETLLLEGGSPMEGVVDRWASALQIPVEDITSVTAKLPSGDHVDGIVVLSVIVTVVLMVWAISASSRRESNRGCESDWPGYGTWLSGVHLTERPFDRTRGCFVGDALAGEQAGPVEHVETASAMRLRIPPTAAR